MKRYFQFRNIIVYQNLNLNNKYNRGDNLNKPIIGIVCEVLHMELPNGERSERHNLSLDYTKVVELAGGIPIVIPVSINQNNVERYIEICDGFIFSGGIDISPSLYNQDPIEETGSYNTKLDLFQKNLLEKTIFDSKPVFCICRGMQLLNIIKGGTLAQDISQKTKNEIHQQKSRRGDICHKVIIEKDNILYEAFGNEYYVNSYHHQCIDKLGEDLKVTSYTSKKIIESVELNDKVWGVQWHPEITALNDKNTLKLFEKLIKLSSM